MKFESEPLGTPRQRNTLKKWNLKNVNLSPRASSELEFENQQNHESNSEVVEGSVRKRMLDFLNGVIDSEIE